jgi:hypothetical protein
MGVRHQHCLTVGPKFTSISQMQLTYFLGREMTRSHLCACTSKKDLFNGAYVTREGENCRYNITSVFIVSLFSKGDNAYYFPTENYNLRCRHIFSMECTH